MFTQFERNWIFNIFWGYLTLGGGGRSDLISQFLENIYNSAPQPQEKKIQFIFNILSIEKGHLSQELYLIHFPQWFTSRLQFDNTMIFLFRLRTRFNINDMNGKRPGALELILYLSKWVVVQLDLQQFSTSK